MKRRTSSCESIPKRLRVTSRYSSGFGAFRLIETEQTHHLGDYVPTIDQGPETVGIETDRFAVLRLDPAGDLLHIVETLRRFPVTAENHLTGSGQVDGTQFPHHILHGRFLIQPKALRIPETIGVVPYAEHAPAWTAVCHVDVIGASVAVEDGHGGSKPEIEDKLSVGFFYPDVYLVCMFDLYVVTDSTLSKGVPDSEVARLAYMGGADAVQLRMKNADGREMLEQARIIRDVSDELCKFFFVNDRIDIAMASGADGVHLGQSDVPVEVARELMGESAIIGISVDNEEQAIAAVEGGADYVGVGSIFRTSTKPDAMQGVGLDMIFRIKQVVDVPVVAIGGINRGNIQDVIRAGADSAAVVSAVVAQDDIRDAAHELKDLILKVRPHVPTE